MRLVSHPTGVVLAAAALLATGCAVSPPDLSAEAPPGPDGQTHAVSAVLSQMADRIAASLLRS